MKIFIAEDELSLARVLSEFLPKAIEGADVTLKADGIEAVTTLQVIATGDKANWPDVILSDYHLGGLNGDAVLQVGAKLFPSAQLILMSGAADADNIERARATISRPFLFLSKPFMLSELLALIKA
ncbi:MAG: response regulator [Patescibacteria group bacterium]